MTKPEVPDCIFPGCTNKRMSIKRRGQNSPSADKSKRSAWCRYHRRGKGKQERIEYARSLHEQENA